MKKLLNDSRGRMSNTMKLLVGVGVLVVAVILFMAFGTQQAQTGDGTTTDTPLAACPSDLTWSGTVDVQNTINEGSAETYDTTAYFYVSGTDVLKTSISDTTAGAVSLTCGQVYDVKVLSTSGAAGDGGYIYSTTHGTANDDGSVTFTATSTNAGRITLGMNQHGVPEIQVFDASTAAFVNEGAGTTGYKATDGVNWTSSTNNTQPKIVGSGGEIDYVISLRSTVSDENLNDFGIYVLIEAPTNIWDVPVVKADGVTLEDVKGTLNPDEAKAYSNYEYVYLIPQGSEVSLNDKVTIGFNIFALSGQNPGTSDDIEMDFAMRGTYTSIDNANILKVGAVDDTTSQAQVYGLHDMIFDVF